MVSVGLVMIVRDEEAVIERALRSALPFIDTYVIVDTGSSDRTLDIARDVLRDVSSGLIVSRPWVDFGKNRTEALALCEGRMDWAIMLDADDNLVGAPPKNMWTLDVDGMLVRLQHGHNVHYRVQVFRMGRGWHYEGRIHEKAETENPTLATWPPETYMITRCEGSRSRDPAKFLKDAALMSTEPPTQRNLFFLAQSYRDAGLMDVAICVYEKYMEHPSDSVQERYMVCVNLIVLIKDPVRQLTLAWEAVELCPWRLEAPFTLLECRRNAGLRPSRQIYALAMAVTNRVPRETDNFVTPAVYAWGFDNELAIVAFALGHFDVAYDALVRCMLNAPTAELQESARKNAKRAFEASCSSN